MQNTTHYNLKKPDYTDFADIQDINDNMDILDTKVADVRDSQVSFTDADLDSGITSFPTFLTKIVSGMKLAKFLRDFKAGMEYVLHVGSLVNNATCTESGKALDARMGKTLHDEIATLNESLERTGDTTAVKFNTNATGDGMSLRYVIPGGDMYVFRMFGTIGGNHFDFVKMTPGGTVTQTFFTSSRKKVASICGGGVLTCMDRVCILDYQSANYNANGTVIPAELRPDTTTFACASIAGDATPYRLGVRNDGTVILQDYSSIGKTTASNVRGQVIWILANT